MSPSMTGWHRVVLGEHVARLVDVAGHRDDLRSGRIGRPADDDLLQVAIDEVRAVHVPAQVEADERRPAALLDGHDLAEEDRGILCDVVAGLAADGHSERPEMAREGRGVGVEVDRSFRRPGGHAESATDVDFDDRMAIGEEAGGNRGHPARAPSRTRPGRRPRASPIRHGSGSCRS